MQFTLMSPSLCGNIPQNADDTRNTQSFRSSHENYIHNQLDVNLQSGLYSVHLLQSSEGVIQDRCNIISKEPPFSHRIDENVGGQRMPNQHKSVVLIGDSISKNIVP